MKVLNVIQKNKSDIGKYNQVKVQATKDNSTQEWLPIKDIDNNVINRRDDHIVGAINIEPINIDLLSDKEKKRIISAAHEAFNGLQTSIQIESIGRPIDLDGYIKAQNNIKEETTDIIRKKLLQGYIKQAAEMASGGDVVERRFYVLMPTSKNNTSKDEILNNLKELSGNLASAGLFSKICDDKELINLNFMFMHPAQSAYERGPKISGPYMPPQLEGGIVTNE